MEDGETNEEKEVSIAGKVKIVISKKQFCSLKPVQCSCSNPVRCIDIFIWIIKRLISHYCACAVLKFELFSYSGGT